MSNTERKEVKAFAVFEKGLEFKPHTFVPKPLGKNDVAVDVTHCGMCHSDISKSLDEWQGNGVDPTKFPLVPGHEVVGHVVAVGSDVKDFAVGDRVGLGPQRRSCKNCEYCSQGDESYCDDSEGLYDPETGGYAQHIRCDAGFVFKIPDGLKSEHAAPLLCAGVTVFSPLIHFAPPKGSHVAVLGIGGLGHLALQYANALGYQVTAISRNESKVEECKSFGSQNYLDLSNKADMKASKKKFSLMLVTATNPLDWRSLLKLLKPDGRVVMVGLPSDPMTIPAGPIVFGRLSFSGSLIGGTKDMKHMLEFSTKHNIVPTIELLRVKWSDADKVSEAAKRVHASTVRYRVVLEYEK